MAYTPTTWTNGSGEPIDAANLNNMETGIDSAHVFLDAHYIDPATTLPGSPADKQRAILVDSLTAPTYAWLFQYESGISDANKWVCIGGSPALAAVETSETTASTSYVALATAGPSFQVPRAGVYEIEIGATLAHGGNVGVFMSYDIEAAGATDADGIYASGNSGGAISASCQRRVRKTLAANDDLVAKYRAVTATSSTFSRRYMAVTPVRVA